MTGSIQEKNGKWYLVISYKDTQNKWKTKWQSTNLPIKGNKKAAESLLDSVYTKREFCGIIGVSKQEGKERWKVSIIDMT